MRVVWEGQHSVVTPSPTQPLILVQKSNHTLCFFLFVSHQKPLVSAGAPQCEVRVCALFSPFSRVQGPPVFRDLLQGPFFSQGPASYSLQTQNKGWRDQLQAPETRAEGETLRRQVGVLLSVLARVLGRGLRTYPQHRNSTYHIKAIKYKKFKK